MSRETQAGKWFARMRTRDAEQHCAEFDKWIADPANAAAYAEAERLWTILEGSSADRVLANTPASPAPSKLRRATALAVAIALTFGLAWYIGQARTVTIIATPSTDRGNVRLADGTVVEILDGTTVETHFSDRERQVVMTGGRARFTVAHDASRPFRVIIGDSEVVALGTVFEIDLTRPAPLVRLISGSVDVRSTKQGGQAVRLKPGEAAEVRGDEPRRVASSDLKPEASSPPMTAPVPVAAPTSRVVADNLSLSEVLDHANRVNGQQIHLADPALSVLKVTGRFDVSDSASLARKLSATFGLKAVQTGGGIVLTKE
ncbi:FecR family protein [Sphingopyxis panaciterrulae]|uniref:Transmembrane sensor n=1 Tax=Sphingopyxis panaciterrulae TaxID=462372 RepID=A0A7W9ER68_9SPHN|nr:FecR domain-containing protein [Sphingopyxis panaciterrulae]MBB5707368.1 transmembrane sensor [Sphingopyxis panaciterrulae]